jgi:hypothetical protein
MLRMCALTVFGETDSCPAISGRTRQQQPGHPAAQQRVVIAPHGRVHVGGVAAHRDLLDLAQHREPVPGSPLAGAGHDRAVASCAAALWARAAVRMSSTTVSSGIAVESITR